MNTKKVAEEYRLSKWAGIIQERKNSGKSIKNFCKDTGISMHSYFYFQRKLRMVACEKLEEESVATGLVPLGWMQLTTEKQTNAMLNIEIGGCHINVNNETDPELLKQVCRILRLL